MTIETFLPSEVARLVLGYLAEIGCQKSHEMFLSECNDLREYASLLAGGLKFSTSVGGKSLLDVLAEYCYLSRQIVVNKDQVPPALLASSNPAASDNTSAGAVYRAARQVLSSNASVPPLLLQQPHSCPPQAPSTPTVATTPNLVPPMTCTAVTSSSPSVNPSSSSSALRNQVRLKYGAGCNQPASPTLRTPAATSDPPTLAPKSIELEEPASNSNDTDPLAGVDSMDPLFDFAKALAENINTVISKEDNNGLDLSLISPEKAGQIIEMTEHDPNFDRFVRSLFQNDNSLPFDNTMDGQDTATITQQTSQIQQQQQPVIQMFPNQQQEQPTVSTESVAVVVDSIIESVSNQQQLACGRSSTQPTTPHPPSSEEDYEEQIDAQVDVPSVNASQETKGGGRKRSRNKNDDLSGNPRKKGRPPGRRDNSQRARSCKVRDPFAPPPPPPTKPVDPAVKKIVKTMAPLAPKLPIPRLHPPPVAAPPLSVLFGNGNLPTPGSLYLVDTGNGNLVMVTVPQQPSPQKQLVSLQHQSNMTRVIISPAEEENEVGTAPPENGVETAATEPVVAGSSATAPIVINDHDEQTQHTNPSGILDSIGFEDLFFNSKSPHRYLPGNSTLFELRTPPADSQSFLSNFVTAAVTSPPVSNTVCQRLVFDEPAQMQQPLHGLVTAFEAAGNPRNPSTPKDEILSGPAPLTTTFQPLAGQTPKSTVSFQSTSDSQQQSGRALRRVPLIPVPTTSTPFQAASPHIQHPPARRSTRSSTNRETTSSVPPVTASSTSVAKTTGNTKRRRDE